MVLIDSEAAEEAVSNVTAAKIVVTEKTSVSNE